MRTEPSGNDRCDKCGAHISEWSTKPCVRSLTQSPRHTITLFPPWRSFEGFTEARMSGYTFRDRIVCAVCNWLLNHVASEQYRAMIGGSIKLGLRTAAGSRRPA